MQARLAQIKRQPQPGKQGNRQDIGTVVECVLHQAFETVQHRVGQVENDRFVALTMGLEEQEGEAGGDIKNRHGRGATH